MSMADKVLQLKQDFDDVYEAGKQSGGGNNTEAFENGKKEVWKGITCDGTRVHYGNAFAYQDLDYFYPCYDMQPTNAGYMFAQTRNGGTLDFVDRLEKCGVTLDFSKATSMARTFYVSGVTRLGVIDCRSTTALDYLYATSTYLHTIELMIVDANNTYNNSFSGTSELANIEFEGEIGNNISFANCTKLTHDSLMSIINHLQVKTSGTFTLSFGSTNLAKLSNEEKAVATQKGWTLS